MLLWGAGEAMRSKGGKGNKGDLEQQAWGAPVPLERVHVSNEDTKRSLFLRFCAGLNLLTTLAMLGVIACNIYFSLFPCNKFVGPYLTLLLSSPAALADLPTGVVRLFSCVFATLVISAEQETGFVSRNFSFLESWVFRGLFIIFIGSLQLLTHIPCELMIHFRMNQGAGSSSIGLGVMYLVLGLLCFRQLRSRTMDQIRKKKQAEMTAQHLVEQRGEIDLLLAETQKRLLS